MVCEFDNLYGCPYADSCTCSDRPPAGCPYVGPTGIDDEDTGPYPWDGTLIF